jgi:hypothetical protein
MPFESMLHFVPTHGDQEHHVHWTALLPKQEHKKQLFRSMQA